MIAFHVISPIFLSSMQKVIVPAYFRYSPKVLSFPNWQRQRLTWKLLQRRPGFFANFPQSLQFLQQEKVCFIRSKSLRLLLTVGCLGMDWQVLPSRSWTTKVQKEKATTADLSGLRKQLNAEVAKAGVVRARRYYYNVVFFKAEAFFCEHSWRAFLAAMRTKHHFPFFVLLALKE